MDKERRLYLRSLVFWFGPTILFLLVAEGAARVFYADAPVVMQRDEILNHVWTPYATFYTTTFENRGVPPYSRRVNGQSWLSSYDFSPKKAAGVYRVAYIGDSFTEGTCPEEDALPTIVGKFFKPTGVSEVEVVNTGTSSYAPTLYYLLLKTKLLMFKPDLVIVNVDMTDVFDDSIYQATLQRSPSGELLACTPGHPALTIHRRTERGLEKLTTFQVVILRASEVSRVVRLFLDLGGELRKKRTQIESDSVPALFGWCAQNWSAAVQADVDWSMSMLRDAIRVARQQGVRVVVTAVPHKQQLEGRWSLRPMAELARVCKDEGVPFLDPTEGFREKLAGRAPSEIYIPGDMHFNPAGYRMWAEIQLEFLARQSL